MKVTISSSNNIKLIKSASGKKSIKISKSSWEEIGRTAGWLNKEADASYVNVQTLISVWFPRLSEEMKQKHIGDGMARKFDERVKYYNTFMKDIADDLGYAKRVGKFAIDEFKVLLKSLSESDKVNLQSLPAAIKLTEKVNEFINSPTNQAQNNGVNSKNMTDTNSMSANRGNVTDTQRIKSVIPQIGGNGGNGVQKSNPNNERINLDKYVNKK